MAKIVGSVLLVFFVFSFSGCDHSESGKQRTVFKQIPEIAEIRPEKPVNIKLKRNADGDYSWELRGDDADRVIETNRKLRETLFGHPETDEGQ